MATTTFKGFMKSTFPVEHYFVLEHNEMVLCDDDRLFQVDRVREELRNVRDPGEVLHLTQRQFGRLPDGELEILERYQADDEQSAAVIVHSSPTWLDQLPGRKL